MLTVLLGTRPEAIKLAPLILECRALGMPIAVIGTGQHPEHVAEILDLFGIGLDHDLALMRPGQSLDHLLGATVRGVGELLDEYRPHAVVVQGDTTSTLGAAVAAFHRRIPIGHVEAGLRSHDLDLPFPEEMNRRATSIVARWHFAPTRRAAENLAAEGIGQNVHVVGNTVVDALRHILATNPTPRPAIQEFVGDHPLILATAHRRESWDGGIEQVALALRDVIDDLPDHRLVFVTHPNPVARAPVNATLDGHARAMVIGALLYPEFLALLQRSRVAVSDSGGIQEEGPTLGIPVIVTRARTEREEGLESGAVKLVGTSRELVRLETTRVLTEAGTHAEMARAGAGLYGDGRSAHRIAEILRDEVHPG